MEFEVKVWKKLLLTWHKRTLIISDNIFKIEKERFGKKIESKIYPLIGAVLIDQSKDDDLKILIGTSAYKVFIKPLTKEDKDKIILMLEEKIKPFSTKNAFSQDYLKNNEEVLTYYDNSPYGLILKKLSIFQNLILEMAQKLDSFKRLIQNDEGTTTDFMMMHNNLKTIKEEMKKQFDEIVGSVYKYHDQIEGSDTSVLTKQNYKIKGNHHNENDISSSEDEFENNPENNFQENLYEIRDNININEEKEENKEKVENKEKKENKEEEEKEEKEVKKDETTVAQKRLSLRDSKRNPYYFLSDKIEDFHDDNYNFEKRTKLPHKIVCPKNIVKEMITNYTKKLPSPVYFNEPISMGQKQCEKFKYIDLLIKVGKEPSKEKQMCYIAAFIIGEIFLNLGRSLKPFSPIIGETYEYFDNSKNFRFYSEHVCHNPQTNAFIAETPEFAYYGDTLNSTSFKFFKGSVELLFKNKTHIHCKKTGDHYIFNPPTVYVKGLMKPPLYNDYAGTTVIQNTTDTSYRCELKFKEEGWTADSLGNFEGTVFKDYETVVYLLGGNWKKEIYMTDPDGNNRIDLLKLDENQEYLKNTIDEYVIPEFSCRLNQITPDLEKILPKNDSRFRMDMRLLEEKEDTNDAQSYKERYENKQIKELCGENHKILFFNELFSPDTDDKYYLPNGKYWEFRKKGKLSKNENNKILDLTGY